MITGGEYSLMLSNCPIQDESEITVAEYLARFLKEQKIEKCFGIIGAGNAALFDAISRLGYTELICTHHEQAAVMAASGYVRAGGPAGVALVTTGAGSTNAITGVASCWADSVPVVVISGNEKSAHTRSDNPLRMFGVQGVDCVQMVEKITRFSTRIVQPQQITRSLHRAFAHDFRDRSGPSWLDIPMDIQLRPVKKNADLFQQIAFSTRPIFYLGNGARDGIDGWLDRLLEVYPWPVLLSWSALDLMPADHPLNFGSCGVYGQALGQGIIQTTDLVIAIGTRLALPQIQYDLEKFAPQAKLVVCDVDDSELDKVSDRAVYVTNRAASQFAGKLIRGFVHQQSGNGWAQWLKTCRNSREECPRIEPEQISQNGYINSYRFMEKLVPHLKPDAVIVTDVGAPLLSGHQALTLGRGQRLFTSQGLGEMGYALPASVGASFAKNKGEVICLVGDGGAMLNLQELQTIIHHKLPIKIFIFNNDGYAMIRNTQKAKFGGRYVGVNRATGVSCPDFTQLGHALGFETFQIYSEEDMGRVIPRVFNQGSGHMGVEDEMNPNGPVICEVFLDPEQTFTPKWS